MIIAKAVIKSFEFGRETIAICTEKSEEKTPEKNAIVLYDSPLAKGIMYAAVKTQTEPILKRNKKFKVKIVTHSGPEEVTYSLRSYECVPAEAIYNKYRRLIPLKREALPENETVHLYNGVCTCENCYKKFGFDRFSCYEEIVNTVDNKARVAVPSIRCNVCGKFYVRADDFRKTESKIGKLNIKTDFVKGANFRTDEELAEIETKYRNILTNMGYYSFLPTKERRTILDRVVAEYGKEIIDELLKEYIADTSVYRPKSNYIWNKDRIYIK